MTILAIKSQKNNPPLSPNVAVHHSFSSGFTLLELMVVILIIGLMTNYVVLSYRTTDAATLAKQEAKKLAYLITLASQDSLMRSRPISLHLNAKGYQFLLKSKTDLWLPSKDKLFKPQRLPKGVTIELNLSNDEDQFSVPEEETAQILLSTSGELTPFTIRLVTSETTKFSELSGQFSGQLKIRHYPLPHE
ncbi:hypothetical protein MNBD_GAMMA12-3366 [hydrothermal vent metagenome]|uniref:Type II secretion system protein H n=1 Tax=hydrothermal vent metagenome TaxID=652676 RepID=A0A3B0Y127_9ZZZZ